MKKTTKKIRLNNFFDGVNANLASSVLPLDVAQNAYNFDYSSGALKTGNGIRLLRIPNANYPSSGSEFVDFQAQYATWIERVYHYRFYDPKQDYKKAHKLIGIAFNRGGPAEHTRVYEMDIPSTNGKFDLVEVDTVVPCPPKNVLNYRLKDEDVLIMCFDEHPMYIFNAAKTGDQRLQKILSAPPMTSMCLHYERLFAVVSGHPNAVWFSKELDPTMWDISLTGAGFIEMVDERGKVTKVVSFANNVYVFREYGIARLTAFADQTQFSLTQLFTSSGRIFEETVIVCGDRIMFLAEDGFYVFDGVSTRKINLGIESIINKSKAFSHSMAQFYNGKYYLSCFIDYPNESEFCIDDPIRLTEINFGPIKNNSLIEIDMHTSRLAIMRGVDINHMTVINESDFSTLAMCSAVGTWFKQRVWELAPNHPSCFVTFVSHRLWQSPKTNFNEPNRKKIVRNVSLICKHDATLTITSDKQSVEINVSGSEDGQIIPCVVRGNEFSFTFFSNSPAGAHIENVEFLVDFV